MVNQISPEKLANMLDSGESFTLIDTRPEDSYEGWRIHGAENIPFGPDNEFTDEELKRIEDASNGGSVVAICGKGLTSTSFSFKLQQHGYDDVSVVKGGMEDWSKVYEVVSIETESDDLVILQLQRRAKGCLGYVVGSKHTDAAVVVDPTRQTDQFKIVAQEAGFTIDYVLDTHVHADHISGGQRWRTNSMFPTISEKRRTIGVLSTAMSPSPTARRSNSARSKSKRCIRRDTRQRW